MPYKTLFDNVKSLIKDDACMKFHIETKPLYLESNMSGIGVGTTLLQTRDVMKCLRDIALDNSILRPIVFARKSLTIAE